MSRFNSLEFEDRFEEPSDFQGETKDEQFYLAAAKSAFEAAKFEQALRWFAKVLEFNPKNASVWTGQVRMLIELEEFHEAKLWADKALEKFPNEAELLAAKAVALGRLGDVKAALAFSDASIEERGDTPYIWLARGDVLLARAEKRAEYCFQKALVCAPTDWFVHWLAARVHFFHKKFSIALKYATDALNCNAGIPVVWTQAGQCQLKLGLLVLAENSFTQAQQLDPQCSEAAAALTKISNVGLFAKISASFRELLHRK